MSGAVLSAVLLPAYLLILARFIGATDLSLFKAGSHEPLRFGADGLLLVALVSEPVF